MKAIIRKILSGIIYSIWLNTHRGRVNQERLKSLQKCHQGRRCFIIGNGPSLNVTPIEKLRNEITIGCNGLFLLKERMGYLPTYYTVEDTLVAADRRSELRALQGTTKVFPFDISKILGRDLDAIWINFIRQLDGVPQMSDDLLSKAYWGGTVTYMNIQLALFLGCNPIYLVGVDHSYNTAMAVDRAGSVWTSKTDDVNHFDPNYFGRGYRWHDPNVARMEQSYRKAREFSEAQGVLIANATMGGELEVFPRVDIHSVLR